MNAHKSFVVIALLAFVAGIIVINVMDALVHKCNARITSKRKAAAQATKSNATKPVNKPATENASRPTAGPVKRATMIPYKGNNAFSGETVSFTGTIDGLTRDAAMQAVRDNGGQAFTDMPARTTLLVIGKKPGQGKLTKADRWGTRKITSDQFKAMLRQPLTLSLEEFEKLIEQI